jgi:hypothetical protein
MTGWLLALALYSLGTLQARLYIRALGMDVSRPWVGALLWPIVWFLALVASPFVKYWMPVLSPTEGSTTTTLDESELGKPNTQA